MKMHGNAEVVGEGGRGGCCWVHNNVYVKGVSNMFWFQKQKTLPRITNLHGIMARGSAEAMSSLII